MFNICLRANPSSLWAQIKEGKDIFPPKMLDKYLLMQLAIGEPLLAKTGIKEF